MQCNIFDQSNKKLNQVSIVNAKGRYSKPVDSIQHSISTELLVIPVFLMENNKFYAGPQYKGQVRGMHKPVNRNDHCYGFDSLGEALREGLLNVKHLCTERMYQEMTEKINQKEMGI